MKDIQIQIEQLRQENDELRLRLQEARETLAAIQSGEADAPVNLTDMSQTIELENELKENREWLATTLKSIGDGVIATDDRGIISFINPEAEKLTGWHSDDAIGQRLEQVFNIVNEITRKPCENPVEKVLSTGNVIGLANHTILVAKDGTEIPIKDSGAPIRMSDGRTVGVVLVFQDDRQNRAAQETTERERLRLRKILDNLPGGVYIGSPDYDIQYVNPALKKHFGSPYEKKCYEYFHDFDVPCKWCPNNKIQRGESIQTEWYSKKNDKHYELFYSPFVNDDGTISQFEVFHDITRQKRAELERDRHLRVLTIRNDISRIFLNYQGDEVYGKSLNVLLNATKSDLGIMGYMDVDGNMRVPSITTHVWDRCKVKGKSMVFRPDDWAGIWGRAFKEKKTIVANSAKKFNIPEGHVPIENHLVVPIVYNKELVGTIQLSNKKGGYDKKDVELVESIAQFLAPVLMARVESARKEGEKHFLEARLKHSQKMESIGTLAGGIAHDFNNILTSIIGFTELSLDETRKGTTLEDNLQEVYSAGKRARNLVKQILAFARHSEEEMKPVQVSTIAKEVLKFIRASIPTTITIKTRIESDSLIMGSATHIHQIFMNLFTNAAQAMEDQGGVLELIINEIQLTSYNSLAIHGLKPGNYLQIKVSDTGEGIDDNIIHSIFEPYFTTKPTGEGTGMGLAVVHGIVESYGGLITVDSEPGKGARFLIYLPIVKKGKAEGLDEQPVLPSGAERILIVDDEPSIVKMSSMVLGQLGYSVTTKTDSLEALELFRSKPWAFDLVISDMTMPNMTGDKLAREFIKVRPDIPVILCTGYSKKISRESIAELGIKAFADKPIVKADLAKVVRKVLDEAK